MKKFVMTLEGSSPLLMHSSRLADPLDEVTKQLKKLSSKTKKTEDDQLAIAETEFVGGLYCDPDVGPYIPGPNVFKTLVEGARLNKLGTAVVRGLIITSDVNPLAYKGPREPAAMWKHGGFAHRSTVVVARNRVVRVRPIFHDWAADVEGVFDETQLDPDRLAQIAENAGTFVGLGDWRPRFGRFVAKVEVEK